MEQEYSTRKTIVKILKTSGPLGVSEIAKRLEITEMAVRRHLNTLERDGYIDSQVVRQSMGRPMHMYRLTEAADDLFPKNYHTLVLDLLTEIDDQHAIGALFDKRKDKLLNKYESSMSGKSLEERIGKLAEIQNANGYMADWERTNGGYVIQEYNCPISQVANRYNEACECEQQLFEQLLQTKVERTECLAKGGNKCVYRVDTKSEQ
jgi:predicted ArsR family transcriptional regulator